MKFLLLFIASLSLLATPPRARGAAADQDQALLETKTEAMLGQLRSWAADPVIISAVKRCNTSLPPEAAAMTEEKWKTLSILDPFVRGFSKNEAGLFLKSRKGEVVSEAFICNAAGIKVAFLNKTSSWSHKGSAKHDLPMSGKTWKGQLEVDDSSGLQQIQVAVPIVDDGKPIGSLVVGLSVDKLLQTK